MRAPVYETFFGRCFIFNRFLDRIDYFNKGFLDHYKEGARQTTSSTFLVNLLIGRSVKKRQENEVYIYI